MKQSKSPVVGIPLTPELVPVLRAVARADLSTATVIGKQSGCPVRAGLPVLIRQGHVQMHFGQQQDGKQTILYSLTAKGHQALREASEGPITHAVFTVAAPRLSILGDSVYDGGDLRPYIGRAGAMDTLRFPSRMGRQLHYPDGRITPVR